MAAVGLPQQLSQTDTTKLMRVRSAEVLDDGVYKVCLVTFPGSDVARTCPSLALRSHSKHTRIPTFSAVLRPVSLLTISTAGPWPVKVSAVFARAGPIRVLCELTETKQRLDQAGVKRTILVRGKQPSAAAAIRLSTKPNFMEVFCCSHFTGVWVCASPLPGTARSPGG